MHLQRAKKSMVRLNVVSFVEVTFSTTSIFSSSTTLINQSSFGYSKPILLSCSDFNISVDDFCTVLEGTDM